MCLCIFLTSIPVWAEEFDKFGYYERVAERYWESFEEDDGAYAPGRGGQAEGLRGKDHGPELHRAVRRRGGEVRLQNALLRPAPRDGQAHPHLGGELHPYRLRNRRHHGRALRRPARL